MHQLGLWVPHCKTTCISQTLRSTATTLPAAWRMIVGCSPLAPCEPERWLLNHSIAVHTPVQQIAFAPLNEGLASSFGASPSAFSIAHKDVMPIAIEAAQIRWSCKPSAFSWTAALMLQRMQLLPQSADATMLKCFQMLEEMPILAAVLSPQLQLPIGQRILKSAALHNIVEGRKCFGRHLSPCKELLVVADENRRTHRLW
jgi:hypothetical protein